MKRIMCLYRVSTEGQVDPRDGMMGGETLQALAFL